MAELHAPDTKPVDTPHKPVNPELASTMKQLAQKKGPENSERILKSLTSEELDQINNKSKTILSTIVEKGLPNDYRTNLTQITEQFQLTLLRQGLNPYNLELPLDELASAFIADLTNELPAPVTPSATESKTFAQRAADIVQAVKKGELTIGSTTIRADEIANLAYRPRSTEEAQVATDKPESTPTNPQLAETIQKLAQEKKDPHNSDTLIASLSEAELTQINNKEKTILGIILEKNLPAELLPQTQTLGAELEETITRQGLNPYNLNLPLEEIVQAFVAEKNPAESSTTPTPEPNTETVTDDQKATTKDFLAAREAAMQTIKDAVTEELNNNLNALEEKMARFDHLAYPEALDAISSEFLSGSLSQKEFDHYMEHTLQNALNTPETQQNEPQPPLISTEKEEQPTGKLPMDKISEYLKDHADKKQLAEEIGTTVRDLKDEHYKLSQLEEPNEAVIMKILALENDLAKGLSAEDAQLFTKILEQRQTEQALESTTLDFQDLFGTDFAKNNLLLGELFNHAADDMQQAFAQYRTYFAFRDTDQERADQAFTQFQNMLDEKSGISHSERATEKELQSNLLAKNDAYKELMINPASTTKEILEAFAERNKAEITYLDTHTKLLDTTNAYMQGLADFAGIKINPTPNGGELVGAEKKETVLISSIPENNAPVQNNEKPKQPFIRRLAKRVIPVMLGVMGLNAAVAGVDAVQGSQYGVEPDFSGAFSQAIVESSSIQTPNPSFENTPMPVLQPRPGETRQNAALIKQADREQKKVEVGNQNVIEFSFKPLVNKLKEQRIEKYNTDAGYRERVSAELVNADTINIALLGIDQTRERMDDFNEKGQGRSDSILLARINPATLEFKFESIARDTFAPELVAVSDRIENTKINQVTMLPQNESEKLTKKIIESESGIPVDSMVKMNIDFVGEFLTELFPGGLSIDIQNDIKDTEFPDSNYGVRTVEFHKGIQKLTGQQLLDYARTRHETTDFDRSTRQRQIMTAAVAELGPKIIADMASGNTNTFDKIITTLQKQQNERHNLFTDSQVDLVAVLETVKNNLKSQNPMTLLNLAKNTLSMFNLTSPDQLGTALKSKVTTTGADRGEQFGGLEDAQDNNTPYMLKVAGADMNGAPTENGNYMDYWKTLRDKAR